MPEKTGDEKERAPSPAEYFAERGKRADLDAVDRLMNRKRGEKPREGDEV